MRAKHTCFYQELIQGTDFSSFITISQVFKADQACIIPVLIE